MKKTLLSLAIAASLGIFSVPALALTAATDAQDVTINELAIPGTFIPSTIVVDQLSGQYEEIFTVTGPGAFNTLAYFNAGGWFNNGVAVPSFVNSVALAGGYSLYALFQSDGTFATNAGVTTFTGNAGTLELWADPDQNTTKVLPSTVAATDTVAAIGRGLFADDKLLGTASLLLSATGHSFVGGGANGDFELIFGDWTLALPTGDGYFTAPRPFYTILDLNGNFQSFDPSSATDVVISGSSANAFFARAAVPEPTTIALLGAGLLGMGLTFRRRKS